MRYNYLSSGIIAPVGVSFFSRNYRCLKLICYRKAYQLTFHEKIPTFRVFIIRRLPNYKHLKIV